MKIQNQVSCHTMSKARFEYINFTASEAEAISGINGENQRNLRRHGYLPGAARGWNRYSIEDLAQLIVIRFLSERGLPPKISSEIARQCAPMIAAYAILGDDGDLFAGAIEGADDRARNELRKKYAPHGLKRYALALEPNPTKIKFVNDLTKIFYATAELGGTGALAFDLKFYALLIFDGVKPRPLVKVIAEGKEAAA
jgi:hypothetical protein